MSLIDFRNLSAPLKSKVKLGAILISGLLVAVIRIGATASHGSDNSYDANSYRGARRDFQRSAPPQVKPMVVPDDEPRQQDSLLKGLMDGSLPTEQKAETPSSDKKPSEFADIRRDLGLD